MSESAPIDPDWKAPADDGRTLLWPDPAQLLAHTDPISVISNRPTR